MRIYDNGNYRDATSDELNEMKNAGGILTYGDRVERLIREKYTMSDEIAILRQRDTKPEEFDEYNAYAERCKAIARSSICVNEVT